MTTPVLLSKVLTQDKKTILMLTKNITDNGWCFIRTDMLKNDIMKVSKVSKNIFKSKHRDNYHGLYGAGYKEAHYKHHLHMITGKHIDDPRLKVLLDSGFYDFNVKMDKIMKVLTYVLDKHIFMLSKENKKKLTIYSDIRGGLLDVVEYKSGIQREFYVEDHVDPGLYSLNIASSATGMEFYDNRTGEWVSMPVGCGAIFCGHAAKQFANIPEVKHRVRNNKIGRFTMWYEVGLDDQVYSTGSSRVVDRSTYKDMYDLSDVLDTYQESGEMRTIVVKMADSSSTGNTYNKILRLPVDATVADLKAELDDSAGIPASKSMYVPPDREPTVRTMPGDEYTKIGSMTKWVLRGSVLTPVR